MSFKPFASYVFMYVGCTLDYLRDSVFFSSRRKIKCTLVQAQRRCTGRRAHRGSRGIALLIYDHGTRRGWEVSVTPRPLFTLGKDPVPIVQGVGWAPRPVWTIAENLAYTEIRSPDRPARSQSLYPATLPGPQTYVYLNIKTPQHMWRSYKSRLYNSFVFSFSNTELTNLISIH